MLDTGRGAESQRELGQGGGCGWEAKLQKGNQEQGCGGGAGWRVWEVGASGWHHKDSDALLGSRGGGSCGSQALWCAVEVLECGGPTPREANMLGPPRDGPPRRVLRVPERTGSVVIITCGNAQCPLRPHSLADVVECE